MLNKFVICSISVSKPIRTLACFAFLSLLHAVCKPCYVGRQFEDLAKEQRRIAEAEACWASDGRSSRQLVHGTKKDNKPGQLREGDEPVQLRGKRQARERERQGGDKGPRRLGKRGGGID